MFCVQLISVPRLCTDSWCHVYKTGFTYWLHDCREGSHLSQSVTTVCFLKTCRSVSLCLVLQFILCWQQQVEWICITMNMYYNECDFVHFGDHLENWPTLWVLVMMCYINLCLLTYLLTYLLTVVSMEKLARSKKRLYNEDCFFILNLSTFAHVTVAVCLSITCAGVYSGIAVPDWSLHIVSVQWHGWNLWCSTDTSVYCQWRHHSCHSSSVQRRMFLPPSLLDIHYTE